MWMRRDWTAAGLATLTAFGLTLGGYWTLGATDKNGQAPTVMINEPTLAVDGWRVKVRPAADTPVIKRDGSNLLIQPGPLPGLELETVNPGRVPATIHATLSVQITSQSDLMSRVPRPAAAPVWHEEFALTLQPGETKLVPIATGAKIGIGEVAMLNLESGIWKIRALTVSAVAPQPEVNKPVAARAVSAGARPALAQAGGR